MEVKLKALIATTFTMMCLYTALHFYGIPLADPKTNNCSLNTLNKILPWSSGCFYSAYFELKPDTKKIYYEHRKLSNFYSKGGGAQHIRWYRAVFYRRFDEHFNLTEHELLRIHQLAIEVNPNRMSEVASFLKYMTEKGEIDMAQTWLNEYCDTYIPAHRDFILLSLKAILQKGNVNLSLTYCRDKRGTGQFGSR